MKIIYEGFFAFDSDVEKIISQYNPTTIVVGFRGQFGKYIILWK